MNTNQVTIGADPELFVFRDGRASSGIGLIGGSKLAPRWVPGGAVQEDNVLAEFNIYPASSEDEWVENITTVMNALRMILPEGTELRAIPSHEYDVNELRSWGPMAMQFGCEPDSYLDSPAAGTPPPGLRTAGGHVHIGYENPKEYMNSNIIAACDIFIGLASVEYECTTRRGLYGGAGCYRNKPYGVEYRTPGNWWLASEKRIRWMFRRTRMAAEAAINGNLVFDGRVVHLPGGHSVNYSEIKNSINAGDSAAADKILEAINVNKFEE